MYTQIKRQTKVIPYLRVFSSKSTFGNHRNCIYEGDKVAIRTRNNESITGIVYEIGSKYIYIRNTPIIRTKKCVKISTRQLLIEDLSRIAKYPQDSQEYGEVQYRKR